MRTVQANPLRHVVTDVLKDVCHPDSGACVLLSRSPRSIERPEATRQ